MNEPTAIEAPSKISRIEEKLDRSTLSEVALSGAGGGVQFRTMTEVMEFSKLMSLAGVAVPPHLRGNPGACLAVVIQATEWQMSPFAVANKSYVVENYAKGGNVERLSYESQLIHAVIEARAPLINRLRVEYEGEGDERVCIVSGTFRGETIPHSLKSSPLGKRRPGRNEKGYIKGSPLWDSKPDLQQFYDTSRDWCRMYCPDVLMGIYSRDEIEEHAIQPIDAIDKSPNLMERLPGKIEGAGFATDVVDTGLAANANKKTNAKKKVADKPEPQEQQTQEAQVVDQVSKNKTQQPEDKPPASVPMPKNRKQYDAWVKDWITGFDNVDDINDRWRAERKLRNECGLVSEETAEIKQKYVDPKIKALSA